MVCSLFSRDGDYGVMDPTLYTIGDATLYALEIVCCTIAMPLKSNHNVLQSRYDVL